MHWLSPDYKKLIPSLLPGSIPHTYYCLFPETVESCIFYQTLSQFQALTPLSSSAVSNNRTIIEDPGECLINSRSHNRINNGSSPTWQPKNNQRLRTCRISELLTMGNVLIKSNTLMPLLQQMKN